LEEEEEVCGEASLSLGKQNGRREKEGRVGRRVASCEGCLCFDAGYGGRVMGEVD
jgi:hypothetical protein